jgi:dihydroflavonol-4-reductase
LITATPAVSDKIHALRQNQSTGVLLPFKKRVFVVGGTGFLGWHTIREFLRNGWEATALGLPTPGAAAGPDLHPAAVKVILRDLDQMSDAELLAILRGHKALVFAAGLDDRVTPKKPAYPKFRHANVELPVRVLNLARQAGVEHAVVFGSYFAHFHRLWPEMRLAERHPYICSRVEQEQAVTSVPGLDVDVLELPYIFGRMPVPGWKPLWAPLVKTLRATPLMPYMRGGTACISAETVGRAAFGAVERGHPAACYPIGQENLTWTEMLTRLAAADGRKVRVVTLPDWMLKIGLGAFRLVHELQGREGGLDPLHLSPLQTAETFLDPEPSRRALGFETGGLDEAFRETVDACQE